MIPPGMKDQHGEYIDFKPPDDKQTLWLDRIPNFVSVPQVLEWLAMFGGVLSANVRYSPQPDMPYYGLVVKMYSREAALKAAKRLKDTQPWDNGGSEPTNFWLDVYVGRKHETQNIETEAPIGCEAVCKQLNAFFPLQWSNSIDNCELFRVCKGAPKGGHRAASCSNLGHGAGSGGESMGYQWILQHFPDAGTPLIDQQHLITPGVVPLGLQLELGDLVLGGNASDFAAAVAGISEGHSASPSSSSSSSSAAAAAASVEQAEAADELEEADAELANLPADGDDSKPIDPSVVARQNRIYESMKQYNPALIDADGVAAGNSETVLGSQMSMFKALELPMRPLIMPEKHNSMSMPHPHKKGHIKCPCIFVRQTIYVHNADGSVVTTSAAAGCSCRHRDDGLASPASEAWPPQNPDHATTVELVAGSGSSAKRIRLLDTDYDMNEVEHSVAGVGRPVAKHSKMYLLQPNATDHEEAVGGSVRGGPGAAGSSSSASSSAHAPQAEQKQVGRPFDGSCGPVKPLGGAVSSASSDALTLGGPVAASAYAVDPGLLPLSQQLSQLTPGETRGTVSRVVSSSSSSSSDRATVTTAGMGKKVSSKAAITMAGVRLRGALKRQAWTHDDMRIGMPFKTSTGEALRMAVAPLVMHVPFSEASRTHRSEAFAPVGRCQ